MKKNTRLKALVIYQRDKWDIRKTIEDSIFCFKRPQEDIQYYFYCYDSQLDITDIIARYEFDIIIFHSIFMCLRWQTNNGEWKKLTDEFKGKWNKALKVMFVQDEQYLTKRIHGFIKQVGIQLIFTVANGKATPVLYPVEELGNIRIEQVLTGYVDQQTLSKVKNICKNEKIRRDIDIGYRADKTPYALGKQGRLKTEIVEVFNQTENIDPFLKIDIKNTIGKQNTFFGLDWFRFLLRCRTMVGCLGGASVLDADGNLRKEVERLQQRYPNCSYEMVEAEILSKYGQEIDYTAISPRCFEMAMTKTCQVLVEGEYGGIFKPWVHYIELKRDFSNLTEVLELIKDRKYCKNMADRTYKDIILSQKHTYQNYVKDVVRILKEEINKKNKGCITKKEGSLCFNTIKIILFLQREAVLLKKYMTK